MNEYLRNIKVYVINKTFKIITIYMDYLFDYDLVVIVNILVILIYVWRNGGMERLNNSPEVTIC
jgi:hypothetical protein